MKLKIEAVINKHDLFKKHGKIKLSSSLIISFASLLSGIISGALIFILNSDFISNNISGYFISFLSDFSNKNFYEIFCGLAVNFLVFYFLVLIFSTSIFGVIPTVAAAFFKAFGMGCLTAYIFSAYELHGFEYFLLIVFPGKIIMLFSILLITETGIESSKNIKQLSQKGSGDKFNITLFIKKMGFILLIMTLSVLVETTCIKLFSPLFEQSI